LYNRKNFQSGFRLKIVQERLSGHASITTTLDIYSHVAPGLQAASALRFDDIVFSSEKSNKIKDIKETN
jgi:integrase